MHRNYKAPFRAFVKKQPKPLQLEIELAVDDICEKPDVGEMKTGDLQGIRVYKFRFNRQEYLVAYRAPMDRKLRAEGVKVELLVIDFYQVGVHENFYDTLKRFLKA